jgi:hypothetical protein
LPFSASETWRAVVGYEGRYEVSDQGRVRSLRRRGFSYDIARATPLLLRPVLRQGYHNVGLRPRAKRVHRLVLEAFVGPCPDDHEGSHLNGVRTDNRLVNLRWETHAENLHRTVEHGTINAGDRSGSRRHPERLARGERHGSRTHPERVQRGEDKSSARVTEAQVREIRAAYAAGELYRELAARFPVSRASIGRIVTRESWRHVE